MDSDKTVGRGGRDPLVFFNRPFGEQTGGTAKGHVMAAALARGLLDGEVAIMGANSLLPLAAARLAQLTHAPNLTILAGASGGVNSLVEPLVPSSGDYSNLVAEAVLDFREVLMLQMSGRTGVFFAGGLQIDRRGSCNLSAVGPHERPTLRGPGSAGLPWAQRSRRTILYATSHTRSVFVPRVDFVSAPGWVEDGDQVESTGPSMVVTALAVLDFTPGGEMRLVSVHPGSTVEEVRDNTGFELAVPEDGVAVTPEPSPAEMEILRSLDYDGLLGEL